MARLVLSISDMNLRHWGLAKPTADDYAGAARVCMDRHHSPPSAAWTVEHQAEPPVVYDLTWDAPTDEERRTYANKLDATRDGAYCISIVSAEVHLGQVVLRRAPDRSGSDWLLVPQDGPIDNDPELDLDRPDLLRLEVSGIDDDDDAKLDARMREKLDQLKQGNMQVPGLAAVVGFRSATVLLQRK